MVIFFRGRFVARGTKVQTRMPIPTIDFDDPKQKEIHDTISSKQQYLNKLYSQLKNQLIEIKSYSKGNLNKKNPNGLFD